MTCVEPDHFSQVDGVIAPQPWMQLRQVASVTAPSKSGFYAVTGTNKNDLLHSISTSWMNDTPMAQWCYGLCTRGGCQVTLQARSRGYLQLLHGLTLDVAVADVDMAEVSREGIGADIGRSGLLAIGTGFCIAEKRANAVTFPFRPAVVGWTQIDPGVTLNARADLRFISEFWENTTIDGGSSSTESSYITGDTRIDLFALPLIT